MSEERKKVWIHVIQTRLLVRLGMYWVISQVCLWNLVFIWRLLQEGTGEPLEQYGRFLQDFLPAIIGSVLVFPVLAIDAVKFAHRVVGPIYRFRKTMQALAAGETVRPIRLRRDDFLTEMRDDFNQMLDTLQRQGVPVLKPAQSEGGDTPRQTA
jgi:methyl-accepting chemotaxis protein